MVNKIDVIKLLKMVPRQKYEYDEKTGHVKDHLAQLLNQTKEDTFYYVGITQFVKDFFNNQSDSEWKIGGVFQLGFPYIFPCKFVGNSKNEVTDDHPGIKIAKYLSDKAWYLFEFTKNELDEVLIGFNNSNNSKLAYQVEDKKKYYGLAVESEEQLGQPFFFPEYFINEGKIGVRSKAYFTMIKKVVQKRDIIERRKEFELFFDINFEFNKVKRDFFSFEYLDFLYRYKKSVINLFEYPCSDEYIKFLKDEIYFIKTNEDIKKGDVILSYFGINPIQRKIKIIANIAEKDSVKAVCAYILRPKKVSPYYLLSYLKSDFVKEFILENYHPRFDDGIYELEKYKDVESQNDFLTEYYLFNRNHDSDEDWEELDIENIPVLINYSLDASYYEAKYKWQYERKNSIQRKIEKKRKAQFYNADAREIIVRDLNELKKCFNGRSFKAAIILAGSILEAFLIDWISEIKEINYFEEDYMIFDKYTKRYRRADLRDYISEIEDLKKPSWFSAAQKATEIRKKRNLVHAKLYINEADISKETCTEVINYLEYVINTRWQ